MMNASTPSNTLLSKLASQQLRNKSMEWWYLAPAVLALVLFLLVGTIFEKKIEMAIRNFLDRGVIGSEPCNQVTTDTTFEVQPTAPPPSQPQTPSAPPVTPPATQPTHAPYRGATFTVSQPNLTCRSKSALTLPSLRKPEVSIV